MLSRLLRLDLKLFGAGGRWASFLGGRLVALLGLNKPPRTMEERKKTINMSLVATLPQSISWMRGSIYGQFRELPAGLESKPFKMVWAKGP